MNVCEQIYAASGRFTFTSHMPGEHVICLVGNSSSWFSGGTLVCYNQFICSVFVGYFCVTELDVASKAFLS